MSAPKTIEESKKNLGESFKRLEISLRINLDKNDGNAGEMSNGNEINAAIEQALKDLEASLRARIDEILQPTGITQNQLDFEIAHELIGLEAASEAVNLVTGLDLVLMYQILEAGEITYHQVTTEILEGGHRELGKLISERDETRHAIRMLRLPVNSIAQAARSISELGAAIKRLLER